MIPKEKAQELYNLMRHEISQNDTRLDVFGINFISKQCALITVDEILSMGIMSDSGDWRMAKSYWQEVRKEIENL